MDALAHLLKETLFHLRLSMEMFWVITQTILDSKHMHKYFLEYFVSKPHILDGFGVQCFFFTCAMFRRHKKPIIIGGPLQSTLLFLAVISCVAAMCYSQTKEIFECGSNSGMYHYFETTK